MGKRDDLIKKYATDLRETCGIEPDMALLTKVAIGCGPAIYNADSALVSGTDRDEVATIKTNFLIRKLGLDDGPALDEGIAWAVDIYGRSNRRKYRAVFYYLLTKHFRKEAVYG